MKNLIVFISVIGISLAGCDSNTKNVEADDILRITNSFNMPDISFRYKFIDGEDTVTLKSSSEPGPETIIDLNLVENNTFNFWANHSGFTEGFTQCTVGALGEQLQAVELLVYTQDKKMVVDCSANWKENEY